MSDVIMETNFSVNRLNLHLGRLNLHLGGARISHEIG